MAGLLPYHIVAFPLREFLADRQVTQAGAARGIGVNAYTLSHWVTSGRTPLAAYKALLQKFDPSNETPFAMPGRYAIQRWASAKPCATTAETHALVARWDARHDGLVLETLDGERLQVRHPSVDAGRRDAVAAPAEDPISAPLLMHVSVADDGTPPNRAPDAGAARPMPPAPAVGSLPPESAVLLALLREVADQRNRARQETAAAEERVAVLQEQVASLETNVATLEGHVSKLTIDVADWMALAEERSASPEPDHTTAVANVRAALECDAPELVATLDEILGNSAGSCR